MSETVRSLHDRAMSYAERAMFARRADHLLRAKRLSLIAYKLERKAAAMLEPTAEHEPSRGVLHRSAAWLALNAGQARVAMEIAQAGLDGQPVRSIRDELLEVLEAASLAAATADEDADHD